MIGIIGAMEVEIEKIVERLDNKKSEIISGIEFVCGNYFGSSVVAAVSGIGKVNAAIAAEAMIIRFSPEFIINTGVAGSLSDKLGIGDIAVSTDVAEHDLEPLGDPKGFIPGLDMIKIAADNNLCQKFCEILSQLDINHEAGTIVSGDQFINSNIIKKKLNDEFDAICCEMEGASIGHVCAVNNVPFCVLRAISDNADDNSHINYEQFTEFAAENSVKVLELFFRGL